MAGADTFLPAAKLQGICQRWIFEWLLRRRLAGASQGEKGKKRWKDTLSGVAALVVR